jgi:hypothetical protein
VTNEKSDAHYSSEVVGNRMSIPVAKQKACSLLYLFELPAINCTEHVERISHIVIQVLRKTHLMKKIDIDTQRTNQTSMWMSLGMHLVEVLINCLEQPDSDFEACTSERHP